MILNDKHELVPVSLMEWARWLDKNPMLRAVHQETVGEHFISTVFLGIDHSFGVGKPLWFETMVFCEGHENCELHEDMDRYNNWAQAEKGHKKMVKKVKTLTKSKSE